MLDPIEHAKDSYNAAQRKALRAAQDYKTAAQQMHRRAVWCFAIAIVSLALAITGLSLRYFNVVECVA